MYKSASGSSLSNGHLKQIPAGGADFGRQAVQATTPEARVIQHRPDSIILHTAGEYVFLYETSQSVGTIAQVHSSSVCATYISGANIDAEGGGNVLPIQPVAWSRQGGTGAPTGNAGDVTFIYRGRPE